MLTFNGLKELGIALEKRTDLVAVKQVVKANGAEMNKRAVSKAQFTKGYSTGATRRSISTKYTDLSASTSAGTDYAPYLEHGTRFMSKQPFIRPAFEEQKKEFINDLKELFR